MKKLFFAMIFACPLTALGQDASSENTSGGFTIKIFPERQQERRQSRWTLANWMDTKKRIAEQNRWLWAHTNKLPVEWALAYTQTPTRWQVESDAYLARLGLHLEYSKRSNWFAEAGLQDGPEDRRSEVAGQIRLFGGNLQDTHLISRVGFEYADFANTGTLSGSFGTWYVEPELQIYFSQWLGVRGNLKYRWAGTHMTRKTQKWGGMNYETAAFIEMGALRLEGGYRWLNWEIDGNSPLKTEELVGSIKLFF